MSTGMKTVKEMQSFNMIGNTIPHVWYKTIKLSSGKVDLNSIIILADICYWYKPKVVMDDDGKTVITKRFKEDLLQRSYNQMEEMFGLTKRQAQDATLRLEERGIIKRHFRTVRSGKYTLPNTLFIELNVSVLKSFTPDLEAIEDKQMSLLNDTHVTIERDTSHVITEGMSRLNERGVTIERDTITDIITKTTTKTTTNKKPSPHYPEDSEHYKMALYLQDKILEHLPTFKKPSSLQSWANTFRLLHEKDGRSKKDIKNVIDFATSDSFWQSNILSATTLRKQFDKLQARLQQGGNKNGKSVRKRIETTELDPYLGF